MKRRDRQGAVQPVENIINIESPRRARKNAQAEERAASCNCINTVGGGKAHFKFGPIVFRIHQAQVTAMEPGQFARQVKTDAVAGRGRGSRAVMETFEDVFARRNGGTSVADRQHDVTAVAERANPNSPTGAIVFSRVLQKVLDD